jgi:DNA-binding protein YbaB
VSNKKQWDLTSRRSLESAAEWIRERSDAIVVVVVRGQDTAFAVHVDAAPADAAELVRDLLTQMVEDVNQARHEKREAETRKRAAAIADGLARQK